MDLGRTPPTQGLTQENPQLQTYSEPLIQPGEVYAEGGDFQLLSSLVQGRKRAGFWGWVPFPVGMTQGRVAPSTHGAGE